jgi:hypothetical protein
MGGAVKNIKILVTESWGGFRGGVGGTVCLHDMGGCGHGTKQRWKSRGSAQATCKA